MTKENTSARIPAVKPWQKATSLAAGAAIVLSMGNPALATSAMASEQPAETRTAEGKAEVYVGKKSETVKSGEEGTQENPYATLEDALKAVKSGGVIKVLEGGLELVKGTTYSSTSQFHVIDKNVTIEAASGTATISSSEPFILGANATFKNIKFKFDSKASAYIAANGYTLGLENVGSEGNNKVNVFGGSVKNKSVSTEGGSDYKAGVLTYGNAAGNGGNINISGSATELGDIYAAGVNSGFEKPVNINVTGVGEGKIGNVYSNGSWSIGTALQTVNATSQTEDATARTASGSDFAPESALTYNGKLNVSISTATDVKAVYGEGALQGTSVTVGLENKASGTDRGEYDHLLGGYRSAVVEQAKLYNVSTLVVQSGTFAPTELTTNAKYNNGKLDLTVAQKATLDFSGLGGISPQEDDVTGDTGVNNGSTGNTENGEGSGGTENIETAPAAPVQHLLPTVNNFTGGGTITLAKDQTLKIDGYVGNSTLVNISDPQTGHPYITAPQSKSDSFTFQGIEGKSFVKNGDSWFVDTKYVAPTPELNFKGENGTERTIDLDSTNKSTSYEFDILNMDAKSDDLNFSYAVRHTDANGKTTVYAGTPTQDNRGMYIQELGLTVTTTNIVQSATTPGQLSFETKLTFNSTTQAKAGTYSITITAEAPNGNTVTGTTGNKIKLDKVMTLNVMRTMAVEPEVSTPAPSEPESNPTVQPDDVAVPEGGDGYVDIPTTQPDSNSVPEGGDGYVDIPTIQPGSSEVVETPEASEPETTEPEQAPAETPDVTPEEAPAESETPSPSPEVSAPSTGSSAGSGNTTSGEVTAPVVKPSTSTSTSTSALATGSTSVRPSGSATSSKPASTTTTTTTTTTTSSAAASTTQAAQTVKVYRLLNPSNSEHLYTTDANEVRELVKIGWIDEGVGWNAPTSGTAVYRLYNPASGGHLYTKDTNEIAVLTKLGWQAEGVQFYSAETNGKAASGAVAIYREFNPNNRTGVGTHNFTRDANEHNALVRAGWTNENVGWYGL